jgi:hypothetical protein
MQSVNTSGRAWDGLGCQAKSKLFILPDILMEALSPTLASTLTTY